MVLFTMYAAQQTHAAEREREREAGVAIRYKLVEKNIKCGRTCALGSFCRITTLLSQIHYQLCACVCLCPCFSFTPYIISYHMPLISTSSTFVVRISLYLYYQASHVIISKFYFSGVEPCLWHFQSLTNKVIEKHQFFLLILWSYNFTFAHGNSFY